MADPNKGAAALDAARRPKLSEVADLTTAVLDLYRRGLPPGDSTGWPSLDHYYTVAPGYLTIVTGWPSSGKSEVLDALLINLARSGWVFDLFSFENQPVSLHLTKILEKWSGKPFRKGPTERLTEDEVSEYLVEIGERFSFADATEGALSIEGVLAAAEARIWQPADAKRGLVIDPWNELEIWVPQGMSKTDYISHALTTVRNWARRKKVHVWIVAHPAKAKREGDKLPIPRPDMISDSQHWWNKADHAITVWRDFENPDDPDTSIFIQKCRFKHLGKIGGVKLRYSIITGQFREVPVEREFSYADR